MLCLTCEVRVFRRLLSVFVFGVANFRFAVCLKTLFESVFCGWSGDLGRLHREAKQPKLILLRPEFILNSAVRIEVRFEGKAVPISQRFISLYSYSLESSSKEGLSKPKSNCIKCLFNSFLA